MLARPFVKTAALATALAIPLAFAVAVPATAAAVTVSTWGDLKAAFLVDGDTVVLGADITAPNAESLAIDLGEAITLNLNGHTLSITTPPSTAAAIGVPNTSTLTINATGGGSLIATGGTSGAGIGGGESGDGGETIINGGTITATGGSNGAGIGGGAGAGGGIITINGGTITATGGERGAGIGGGTFSTDGGTTTITGGTTSATGGTNSAGIGGGDDGSPGTLDIHGTPNTGASLDGGGPRASLVTNTVTPAGVGYSAAASLVGGGGGGKIIVGFNYLVTFDAAGGISAPAAAINAGDAITAPADPSRDGYTFTGWTLDGVTYNFAAPVTKPITLTATWAIVVAAPGELAATGIDLMPGLSVAALLLLAGLALIALRLRTSAHQG